MQPELDVRLGFQPDIYQRYGFLARVIATVFGDAGGAPPAERLRLLDVGSGPVRLTETFAPAWVDVTRADVSTFDDPAIVPIAADGSLSFPDRSMDVVLAMDVLEHVPKEQRARVIAECRRVARRCVILAGPVHTREVVAAERAFAELARAVSGRDVAFLEEHARFGLPDADAIAGAFDAEAWRVVTVDNSPLAEWQVFNGVDFIYASDLGDGEPKHATNARINGRSPFRRSAGAHYRTFVCAFTDERDAGSMRALIEAPDLCGPALSPLELADMVLALLPRVRADIRQALGQASDHDVLSAKDLHIAKLTDLLVAKDAALAQAAQQVASLQETAAGERAAHAERTATLERQLEVLHGQSEQRLAHIRRAEQARAEQASRAEQLQRDADRLHAALGAVRSSLSWKLTSPVRLAMRAARSLGGGDAGQQSTAVPMALAHGQDEAVRHGYAVISSSPLFDPVWYRGQAPDAAAAADPLEHYLTRGAAAGLHPHPLFDTAFYLAQNPDVAAAGIDPLVHYITCGANEGRQPHPLFDGTFYLAESPDVAAAEIDPLAHYVTHGAAEGRRPHPLFDPAFYASQNPELAGSPSPLQHYLSRGAAEGLDPHPLFDTSFYVEQNPTAAASGVNPLVDFLLSGARAGRNPHPSFDTAFYLEQNPDLAAAGVNPLIHYVTSGAREGRRTMPQVAVRLHDYTPPEGLLPWFTPLRLRVSDALATTPRLNVLLPGLAMKHMSGGPNTAIALACALAANGVGIRFVSTDAAIDADSAPFWEHVRTLARTDRLPAHMALVDAHDRTRATPIGANDLFMATAWWTAQQAKYATRLTRQHTFLYLIQDYEPLLHAASTQYALASETYELPHLPIINTSLLHEFLTSHRIGRFRDEAFARSALVFEPALDRTIFHPRMAPRPDTRRRLLFYARPTNGLRNLFELGVAALQKAVADGVFEREDWQFLGMGEPFAPVALGSDAVLRPAEWVSLEGYARQMRESDVLLSLMLSPHPSYPPLEMAASGGVAVTSTFENKTAERLASLSPNIIGVPPTIESIAAGLADAVRRLARRDERLRDAHIALPGDWSESFSPIVPRLLDELALLQGSPALSEEVRSATGTRATIFPGFRAWAGDEYEVHRRRALGERRRRYRTSEPGLISFLTPSWNTDPVHLEELAATVLGQDDATSFEWILLDNGSTRSDTRACLDRLGQHPAVRLHRSDENVGIIAGTRLCLEAARNRYIVPLDHDDLIAPDAARVLASALKAAGYPALAYSDEDKIDGDRLRDPYFKPDWDPVLFVNSCYTSHLCAIDRRLALELGAYTDQATEGSPDWDTFMRFHVAGHVPRRIPEVLYTWRMHEESTAGNFRSKPYIFHSQRGVIGRALAAAARPELYELQPSPLFDGTPDWWIRRTHRDPWPVTTVLVAHESADVSRVDLESGIPHQIVRLDPAEGVRGLQTIAARCAETGTLLHLLWAGTTIEEPEWAWEAMGHFELFPDTVMIGGRIHDGRRIRMAGRCFGFGGGCDSPDSGRSLDDPGYFGQMWKQHSVSAVSVEHCVVRADFLAAALPPLTAAGVSLAGLGPWLGAAARARDLRVVYSPFFLASTQLDLESEVGDIERAAFRSAYRELLPETRYLSPTVGLSPATAYRPVAPEVRLAELDAPFSGSYENWSAAEAMARAVRYAREDGVPTFSLLTTVYSGTKGDLFRETSRSLFAQRRPFAEWVILAHGPIAPAVESVLQELAADARVRVLRQDVNVGIVRGLGLCLQQASADYIVPMDADDLLTPDALHVLASEIRTRDADLVYSDEDTWRDGDVESPFFRPDFDLVLNAESSYVWHVCAFRRDAALRLGVYTDTGAEFCHDWDTITRFAAAGASIAHAAHVLYHWRAHSASQSNSGGQNPGSLASTKHVMARTIARLPRPALYEIAPFPVFRGAEEWYIRRRPVDPPAVDAVLLGDGTSPQGSTAVLDRCGFPFRAVHDQAAAAAPEWTAPLHAALRDRPEYVLVVSDNCKDLDQRGVWEAVKLLEMHRETAVVSGRLLSAADVVVNCGRVPDKLGRLVSPFAGISSADPGPFAMALKAHRILSPADGLFMVRADFLARALARQTLGLCRSELSAWLAACAIADGVGVAYSPLLHARTRADDAVSEDADRTFRRMLDELGVRFDPHSTVLGVAGLLNARTFETAGGAGTPAAPPSTGERLQPVSP
jgi:glycosyltransferase involved in cell wall biosynthesis